MTPVSSTPTSFALDQLPSAASGLANDHEGLAQAAKQFEAIFLRQMLSAARGADFGGDDLMGSQAQDTFREMRDARFAEVAAQSGTMGMADIIEAQLTRFLPSKAAASTSSAEG